MAKPARLQEEEGNSDYLDMTMEILDLKSDAAP